MKKTLTISLCYLLMLYSVVALASAHVDEDCKRRSISVVFAQEWLEKHKLHLMLPTELPTFFRQDTLPSIAIEERFDSGDKSDVKGILWFNYKGDSEKWFSVIVRIVQRADYENSLLFKRYDTALNDMHMYTEEYKGEARNGPYHWRHVYIIGDDEMSTITGKELMAVYEIVSGTVDLAELLEVAGSLHVVQ